MFTGLIQDVGVVERVVTGGMTDLWLRTSLGAGSFALGESIAVDGACLTVVERGGDTFKVQAAPETLRRTTMGELRPGTRVNLERAMALGDRLGGHLVAGHVDAVSEVLETRPEGGSWVMAFRLPQSWRPTSSTRARWRWMASASPSTRCSPTGSPCSSFRRRRAHHLARQAVGAGDWS
ncbi:riboflavin synthase alpha chain, partial [Stigmatella aurantiaca DW4/3-1]